MGEHHLKLAPHKVKGRDDAWWYETVEGIEVVVEKFVDHGATTFVIPWAAIRAALKRKETPDAD